MKLCLKALNLGIIFFGVCGFRVQADDVYVSNTGAGTITQINSSGGTSIFASGLDDPEGLAFDSAGNLYVADSGDGTISKIDPAGNVSIFASGLNGPTALAFDSSGNLCVATPANQTILKIDSSGNVSVFATGMAFNTDGAYLASDNAGNIYANTSNTVQSFDSNGNRSTVISTPYGWVEGMAVNGAGNIYFGKENGDYIYGNGGLNTSVSDYPAPYYISGYADVAGLEDPPFDLAFDANGNLYAYFGEMANFGNNGGWTIDSGVLIEFGVNGDNSVVATGIAAAGGTAYIAVQPVPEPATWTMVVMGFGVLVIGCRFRRSPSSSLGLGA